MTVISAATLEAKHIRLAPLSLDHHERLCQIGLDEALWRYTTIRVTTIEDMRRYIEAALAAQEEGLSLPFVIIEKRSEQIIGSTRFHSIQSQHRRLEIGYTWIAREWQRTFANTEAKYLMLRHAFESLQCVRVQFQINSTNELSKRALVRIGAREEGTLRSYIISDDKGRCDVTVFSILAEEWPNVKGKLESKLR